MHGQAVRDGRVDLLKEPQHVLGGVALLAVRQDLASGDVHRANKSVVPLRLSSWVIVPARPDTIGRLGWVRSIA